MSLELQSLLPYPNSCVGASPHQQARDTKMLSFCGIDVSKDRLDVMVLPEEQCCSVPNDASGWAALVERLRNFSIMAIGLEASGGYERGVMRALLAAGMSVRQELASMVKHSLAVALQVLVKSDTRPGLGQDHNQCFLAALEWIAPEVITVQLDQVEGV